MNHWAQGFLRPPDHRRLEQAARLHDQDLSRPRAAPRRPPRAPRRRRRLFRVHRRRRRSTSSTTTGSCANAGASLVLYLPKIQTAEEAALWNDILSALEQHLGLPDGAIKVYVLVEQVEACFQLMEIRAALGKHFVGFNTGRWDYINSVADAMAWDPDIRQPEHRRHHDDLRLHAELRGPRAARRATRPTSSGQCALWQGGMEPNIPVGSEAGVTSGMKRAVAGAEREQREGASGKWVAHWKMVHIVRPVWEKVGTGQPARTHIPAAHLHAAPTRTVSSCSSRRRAPIRGARDLLSVALQYGNAFWPGTSGRRAQTGRLFRQRRRAVPDGRHGDRRNPPQHPLGMAAQERVVHRGR